MSVLVRFVAAVAVGLFVGWLLHAWRNFPTQPATYVGFATVALVYYGLGTVGRLKALWSGEARWRIDRSEDEEETEKRDDGSSAR